MKIVFLFISSLFIVSVYAQSNQLSDIKQAVKTLHSALVNNDTVMLEKITENDLTYGHSNGWVQLKTDVIKDASSGVLVYKGYEEDSIEIKMNKNVAAVRFTANVDVVMKGTAGKYRLKVLEVWMKRSGMWRLFARQAVKA